ncbi:MAG: hypothetical protein JNJ60_10925 [Rhodocyclaceae bacterium]|nr:hypothetical protein [Rhodocyclaceae bacterium]
MFTPSVERVIARVTACAMLYASCLAPAEARDTDIYLATPNSDAIAEPAILMLLDTSDSMNAADGWREYPGAYDSHVEYLWNDLNFIHNGSSNTQYAADAPLAVSGASYSATTGTVTVTTATTHGLAAGEMVSLRNFAGAQLNGSFIVASIPSTTQFQYVIAPLPASAPSTSASSGFTRLAQREVVTLDTLPIASVAAAGTTISVTTSVAHGLAVGDSVSIHNVSDPAYVGTFDVTAVTGATSFDYVVATAPAGSSAAITGTTRYVMRRNAQASAKAGYWGGNTPEQRIALWSAARDHARGTDSLDSALAATPASTVGGNSVNFNARHNWRNYNDLSWIYWLPASTSADDARLRSSSFNRWRGWRRELGSGSGGAVNRAGIVWSDSNDFADRNACTIAALSGTTDPAQAGVLQGLVPSTVFAPSTQARNSGRLLGQKWLRWDRLNNLDTVNLAAYPGANRNGNSVLSSGTFRTGYLGFTGDGVFPSGANLPARDNANVSTPGDRGQPIRVQGASSSSAWVALAADHGGYNHRDRVSGLNDSTLAVWRALYGYNLLAVSNTTATAGGGTPSNEVFSGWLGNRDGTPAFGLATGTPAYYDAASGVSNTSGTVAASCAITTRICGISGETTYFDATDTARRSGGSCVQTGSSTSTSGPGPTFPGAPDLSSVADCGFSGGNNSFPTIDNHSCAFTGPGVAVEGVGAVYPDSSCVGTTSTASAEPATHPAAISGVTTACQVGGRGITIAGVSHHATCNETADTSVTCNSRFGANCNRNCNNQSAQNCTGGTTGTATTYPVYNRQANDDYLYHDCEAGHGAGMFLSAPAAFNRPFQAAPASGSNNSYTSTSSSAVDWSAVAASDMYSVNWLNWKFGPKGPGGHPIGRKSRLQIAKDALTDLAATTNGVRFGLEVFNKTRAADAKADGGNIAFAMRPMGVKDCSVQGASTTGSIAAASNSLVVASTAGFSIGDTITIAGAGNGGTTLTTTIVAIDSATRTFQVSNSATTGVTDAAILVPTCSGSPADAYPAQTTDWAYFNNRAQLIGKLNALTAASRTPLTESLYEAYLYFRGEAPRFGTNSGAANAGGTESDLRDTGAVSGSAYQSPMLSNPNAVTPASCQKNYVILISDGGPEDDHDADTALAALNQDSAAGTRAVDGVLDNSTDTAPDTTTHQFESSPGQAFGPADLAGGGYIWLDELAYYMNKADMNTSVPDTQNVSTYTIGFGGANPAVLVNTAAKGGGQNYVAEDSRSLADALASAIAAIREWTPSIATPTVPAAAYSRADAGEDIYMAFFAPTNAQAWSGTLKKFKFGHGATLCGTDPFNGDAPIDTCIIGQNVTSGSTVRNVEQFVTDSFGHVISVFNDQASSYWASAPGLNDGGNPRKGGTGDRLLAGSLLPSTRQVYTFIAGVSGSADLSASGNAFTESNSAISAARLGNSAMSAGDRAALINYTRGGKPSDPNCSDTNAGTACNTWRDWPHAAIVHSAPRVVTYDGRQRSTASMAACQGSVDADGNPDPSRDAVKQWIYYLTHDGMLHAVDTCTGDEQWSFVLEEALPQLKALMDNRPGAVVDGGDGPITVLQIDANRDGTINASAGDKVWLFVGLRRGGRAWYALDVTSPDQPTLLWKVAPGTHCVGATCAASSDFDELSQTWSPLVPAKLTKLTTDTSSAAYTLALFGGAGYDPNQDATTVTQADSAGRAVFVLNATNGSLIRKLANGIAAAGGGTLSGMDWSIPSEVRVINANLDGEGLSDRAYVGDMGGNLWRFDVFAADPALWTGKRLAALSDDYALPGTAPNRKIFQPPSAVKINFFGQRYDAVFVGTGDIEHPLKTDSSDALYMVKDFDLGLGASASTAWRDGDFLSTASINTTADFATAITAADWVAKGGWKLPLRAGEKLTAPPTVFFNILRFPTYKPDDSGANACQPPGLSRLYGLDASFGGLINNTGTGNTADARIYAGFSGAGLIGSGSVVVSRGDAAGATVTAGESICTTNPQRVTYLQGKGSGVPGVAGTLPLPCAVKSYWYREGTR